MRTGIIVEVSAADRTRLQAIVADRNSPQKHVWRAEIVLLTADGLGPWQCVGCATLALQPRPAARRPRYRLCGLLR
ncbi:hypothetical protein GCM10011504_51040 [Siccirubricoccus deserti]|nr:hypothetical protein GCM10011504_51040 [Siccirubricoccus deserti]